MMSNDELDRYHRSVRQAREKRLMAIFEKNGVNTICAGEVRKRVKRIASLDKELYYVDGKLVLKIHHGIVSYDDDGMGATINERWEEL